MNYVDKLNKISEIKDEDARKEAIKKLDEKEARIKSWNQPHKVKARNLVLSLVLGVSATVIMTIQLGIVATIAINTAMFAYRLDKKL